MLMIDICLVASARQHVLIRNYNIKMRGLQNKVGVPQFETTYWLLRNSHIKIHVS